MMGIRGHRFVTQTHFKCIFPCKPSPKRMSVAKMNRVWNMHQPFKNTFLNRRFNQFSTTVVTVDAKSFVQKQLGMDSSHTNESILERIYQCCAKERFVDALHILQSHPKMEFTTPILRALEKRNRIPEALSLYKLCSSSKIHLNQEGYSLLFMLERRWKRFVHLWRHFNDMKKYEIVPNATIINTLAEVCLETANFGMASHLFSEIRSNSWGVPLNGIDMNPLVKTFAEALQIEHAFAVLEFMRERDLELSISTLVSLAKACFKANSLYGKVLHAFIVNNGIPIDFRLKVCLIRVYAAFYPHSIVLELLRKDTIISIKEVKFAYMVHAALGGKIHPDSQSIFQGHIDFPSLHEFIRKFGTTFAQPRPPVNDGILKLLATNHNQTGLEIFFRGIDKSTDNWNTMMSLLLQQRQYERVIDLLNRMPTRPNMTTFGLVRTAVSGLSITNPGNNKGSALSNFLLSNFRGTTTAQDIRNHFEEYSATNSTTSL